MTKSEQAGATFDSGFSCSQAVFAAFAEDFGLDRETALKISQAMGGGMAHLGFTCGAVTGAFLAISLRHGRCRADDLAAKEKTYALMTEFVRRFKARHGQDLTCPGLIGVDLGTAEGTKEADDGNLFEKRCEVFVRDAAAITEDLLK
ncbi:MAG: C_GCAxxG_C_C family protein [Candidatus Aminicenantes bacterium]|nr:C_GCAxxG_C_C family protein [Candidatus Aminicenantes bacterium]